VTERDDHARYSRALAADSTPAAFVDLDGFEHNLRVVFGEESGPVIGGMNPPAGAIASLNASGPVIGGMNPPAGAIASLNASGGKPLRIASKSVRSIPLLERIQRHAPGRITGLMAYSAKEAAFLVERGFSDVLLAYPTLHGPDLELLARKNREGAKISLVVDAPEHVEAAAKASARVEGALPLVIELDLSLRPLGGDLAIGALRSPLHHSAAVVELARRIADTPRLSFHGLMAYEAHVAGMTDQGSGSRAMDTAKWLLKRASRRPLEEARAEAVHALTQAGLPPLLVNGGGTGSLRWCQSEAALTELTVGSAFLAGHLFDGYRELSFRPALHFALEVVRSPRPGVCTVRGGGFIASGESGPSRAPVPVLPSGLRLTKIEGAGEVQTPLVAERGSAPGLGSLVFFRPAKSGELAERFEEYALIRGDRVEERVRTYRGEGRCFP